MPDGGNQILSYATQQEKQILLMLQIQNRTANPKPLRLYYGTENLRLQPHLVPALRKMRTPQLR